MGEGRRMVQDEWLREYGRQEEDVQRCNEVPIAHGSEAPEYGDGRAAREVRGEQGSQRLEGADTLRSRNENEQKRIPRPDPGHAELIADEGLPCKRRCAATRMQRL